MSNPEFDTDWTDDEDPTEVIWDVESMQDLVSSVKGAPESALRTLGVL